ncbi:hypothetical protein SASPL_121585 [Salvia splendens]|uniref:Uncharacterized protein n=1 Tax=Salvia splendens TaxID=180675 RepID=A0A8X8XSP9_SALSN|nr:uncharacterized protein LOC121741435 [Salvia splendens]KAG6419365.1 hypothetical protein SASPL_121585 [Salvia splendens]
MRNEDRSNSVPEIPQMIDEQQHDDSGLDGAAAPIKLLLKLIQDHKDACGKGRKDSRRMLRVATMVTILDTVRTRIQKCQSFGNKTTLRRCNTGLSQPPKGKKGRVEAVADEKEKLRRELTACTAARKRLELMCSSLGKEKEIMAAELSRKAHELSEMEDLMHGLKAQNEKLVSKVQECVGGESQGREFEEQNKFLREMLVRSHDGYQSMKERLNEERGKNMVLCSTIDEMREKIESSFGNVRRLKERAVDVDEDIESLENVFEHFQTMLEKHDKMQQGFSSVQVAQEEDEEGTS